MKSLTALLAAAALAALVLATGAPGVGAGDEERDDDSGSSGRATIELDRAELFVEINATDGDAGIQIALDGEGWDRMRVRDPFGKTVLDIKGKGAVGRQGVTELALESAEPSFDEQTLDELLALFPEGVYRFSGRTTEGDALAGEATLTHALPMAPMQVYPVDGDDTVDPDAAHVEWLLVADPPGSAIVGYEVVVERDEDPPRVFQADVSSTATRLTIPPEFLEPGTAYKWEVLAIESSGNRTIAEAEFETAD